MLNFSIIPSFGGGENDHDDLINKYNHDGYEDIQALTIRG